MKVKDIVNRIYYFRNEKNLSCAELSNMINKHEGYISKLESTNFNLPTSVLFDILEALEVTPSEFFAENYRSYNQDNELLALISSLSKEKKESLIKLIQK